jgi:hypothetical protein
MVHISKSVVVHNDPFSFVCEFYQFYKWDICFFLSYYKHYLLNQFKIKIKYFGFRAEIGLHFLGKALHCVLNMLVNKINIKPVYTLLCL